jgi:hypothetical protein
LTADLRDDIKAIYFSGPFEIREDLDEKLG